MQCFFSVSTQYLHFFYQRNWMCFMNSHMEFYPFRQTKKLFIHFFVYWVNFFSSIFYIELNWKAIYHWRTQTDQMNIKEYISPTHMYIYLVELNYTVITSANSFFHFFSNASQQIKIDCIHIFLYHFSFIVQFQCFDVTFLWKVIIHYFFWTFVSM